MEDGRINTNILLQLPGKYAYWSFVPLNMWCTMSKTYSHIFLSHRKMVGTPGNGTDTLHVCKEFPFTFLGIKKKSALTLWASRWLLWNSTTTILKTEIYRRNSGPFSRRSIIHFSCCHDVSKHDKWFTWWRNMATKPHCSVTLTSISFS